MHRTTKIPVTELNPHLICVLCGGYLIDATTIIECLHSFCRTCITRYLEGTKYCPICDVQVHKTRPLLNIRPDKTLQDLVYKLIPGLYKDEMKIRRKFYEEHPEAGPCQSANASEERGEVDIDKCPDHEDEQISLCLQHVIRAPPYKNESSISKYSKGESEEKNPDRRHLLCPADVNVGHLKKFIKFKFELSDAYQIDVFHSDETLRDDYTLMDIAYLYAWKRRTPLKLFYRVRDVTLKPMTCLPEVTQDQPISDAETVTPEGKRKHSDKSGLVSAKKAKLAHDDEDADDEAENTAENDDKSADNADVSAESSDTVIYEQAGNTGDNENDSDKTVDCQVMMECEQTVKTDAGSSTQVASAEAATDGGNSQASGDDKDIQCPSVEQKEVASKDVTPVSEGIQKGNPTTTDTITMSKNIFSIMAKEALSRSFVQSEAVATTSCEKTPAPATAAPQTPVTSQKPTTSVKPLPLNKAPGSTKTVLSQKRPGSLPPITINKRWIPNQVPVQKARPIAAKPASPPGGSGVSSPGKSGGSPKSSSPSSEPGSPGKGKLLVKGGKMGVSASLANTIGRTTTVSKTTPAVVKDKPPVKSLSPVAPAAKDEEKKDGGAVSPPTGKSAPVPTKNGASPPKVHMQVSRSKVTISKALLSSKPATPARKVAPKPPTSRVTPTSRIIPAGPALRPPASPVNQAVVIPSGLKTFTMRPAGTTANGFTTPGSVQVISPGGGLPPGPLTQIRFSGPLPGGKVPSTMVLTGSQVATLMGAPGVLRGPRTLAPSPATSPTSPSKVLNNSLPTGLSAVIDKLQYRSAKTLTFQPVVPGSTIMTSQPHTIMTPQPQTMMTSQPHTVMTAHPHVIMTSQPQTIIRSQPHRMMTSQAQHVHQPGATPPGVTVNKSVNSHQMAAPATVASTQIQVTAPAINVSKNQTTNIAPVLNSTAVSITVTGPPQAHVASSSNGAQTNTSVPMATTGTSTLGKQGSLDSAEDSQVSERDSQSEVEIEIENSPGGNNNNAVVDGGVEAAETDTGTQTSVPASPCPSSSPSTLRASPCVVVVSSIKSSDLNDSVPANSTSGGRPASRPDPGIEQMVVSVVEQADVAQLQSGDRESTQGKSSGSVSAASQAGASGVSCPPTPPAPPPPVPNSSVTAVVDIPAKQPSCQQPPSSNNISENQEPNSGGLGSGPSRVAPTPATHPRDMFTETPVDPGLYSSTSAGLIMLANVAGAAADRDSLVMPGTSLSPLKPALPPLPPPSPQQPARAPAPSVSVAPVVSKTSVETQTQTSDSLDEGLRRVPASLPLPANPAQSSGSRDRYESLAPPAGNPGEKEPPIKKLKMMCHGIDAERKVHSRSGQGHRRMQPRQLNNSSSSVNGGVTMGGRSSDPKCMTPPGGDKRFSPTAGRHQFSPTLPRPTLHVPMVTKNNYIQPVIGMTSPGSAVPPSIIYFPTPVAASAPAPNQLLPIRPANQATIAPPIPKINMGRHGNGVRHGVARPMPNHNNNNKDYPRVNPVPNDPLANGYDAPLELTTKKGRDRKKSEEGIVKCPAKPPSTVVPNAALRP